MNLDILIRNGVIVDGAGGPRRRADIGIAHGRIEAIGDLAAAAGAGTTASAEAEIDASGLVVAPGFVDIHSHSDFTLLVDPRALSQICQGVTTEVIGNCGHGCAPIAGDPGRFTSNIYGYRPDHPIERTSFPQYLEQLEAAGPAVNVAAMVPHGNLRLACVEDAGRGARPEEVTQMKRLLSEALEAGAFGYSTGLEYPAERESSEDELAQLCAVVAAAGGVYAAHTRNRERFAVEGVEEAVRTARRSGVRLQVSHLIPRRGGPANNLERCIDAVDRGRAAGMDAAFDIHTRLHGITNLINALPPPALEGGPDAVRARLADRALRAGFRRYESIISSFGLGGWDRVSIFTSEHQPELRGRSIAELTPRSGDAFDAICEVLLREAEAGDPARVMCICRSYDEAEILRTAAHPACTVGSDATALCPDGPLATDTFLGAYTWASWFVRRAVTETRTLTLERAVEKLTSAPAERIGLRDRGWLVPGLAADIVVFDPAGFRDMGTLEEPNVPASGMVHVIVNGEVALHDGKPVSHSARAGRVLRRE